MDICIKDLGWGVGSCNCGGWEEVWLALYKLKAGGILQSVSEGLRTRAGVSDVNPYPRTGEMRWYILSQIFPGGAVVKNPSANTGDRRFMGSVPGLGRSPGEGKGNLLQYSCMGNPMVRGAWWVTAHGVTEHSKLYKILQGTGIPEHLTCLMRNLYAS